LNENTFELTPKTDDQVVKMIRLQFKGAYLSTLDIHNTLSQDIHIAFSHVQYNAVIDDAVFEFHIPDGIDVVEQ
jgi:outer membrane lipoprotein carrier protein